MAATHTPRRVVCLQPSATVILEAIGQRECIVGCTRYCADVVAGVRNGVRAILSDSWTAQAAQIVACEPDLVIAAVPYQDKAVSEILKSGARFLGLAPRNLRDIYTDIATIAGIMGVVEHGERVIADMQQAIGSVRARTSHLRRPNVFCEEWGKPIIASQHWVAELVEAAGGQFVGTPGRQTTAQAVLDRGPEVLIAAWCGAGDRVPLERIVRERGWQATPAARHGRVYCIRDEFLNTPAPTLIHGLHALAAAIHPQESPPSAGLRPVSVTNSKICDADGAPR